MGTESEFDYIKRKSLQGKTELELDENYIMYVGFKISSEEYGIDIKLIKEIIRNTNITPVPNVSRFVEGVINLRGEVVPLIDLRKKFNMKEIKRGKEARIIVVEVNNKYVGIYVDKVTEVLKIPVSNITPPPQMVGAIEKEFIKNVGKLSGRLILIVDIEKIISKK